jgi:aminoglycoside phosphotransferase (APT) family kinase protein
MNKDGEPLERGNIDFNSLSKDQQKQYIVSAGEILSKIHSIKTDGYGGIRREGKTEFATSDNIIDDILYRKERMYTIAEKENLDKAHIDKAMNIVEQFRKSYAKTSTYLNHGDYSHKHFMIDDQNIVAILDWGSVRSDIPIYDFAWWDYWFNEDIPTTWLKEGYQNKALFDTDFEDTSRLR